MEIEQPTWLDACYLQKVLQKAEENESIELSSVIVKPATAEGDNFASDMYRASVVFTRILEGREITETTSLIVKVAPQDGIREELISNAGFFKVEMSMISESLPWMNQILTKLSTTSLAARCLHIQHEKPIHLVIEDLAPGGFRMADRQAGLDLDHCLLAILNLAVFHASSVALAEKTPDIPTWIDTCYVQNILRKTENDESINVSKTTVKPATAKGDNYLSDMYRLSVEFTRVVDGLEIQDKRSLIVKIAPMDVIREEMISTAEVFKIEILMMSNTLPRMNLILTELGMTTLSAQCLFIQKEKPMHLLFEDLGSRGFRMADRQGGLDLDHCLLAVQNLGRFHASSVALKEKDPKALAIYTKGLYHEDYPPSRHAFVNAAVKAVANETRNWNELNPRISEKLLKLSEVVFDKACEVAMYREDDFNVLNHGDFWINNMLFSYDEAQKPIDHIFVDFQICHYGSPAIDLLFFLATSPSDDVRINHRGKLLRKYHESLTSTMAKMKCNTETLSFDDLEKILTRHALFEAIICCVSLPMVLLDKSKAESFDELVTKLEGGYDNPGCRETAYRKIMTRLLPLYDSMGLFDE